MEHFRCLKNQSESFVCFKCVQFCNGKLYSYFSRFTDGGNCGIESQVACPGLPSSERWKLDLAQMVWSCSSNVCERTWNPSQGAQRSFSPSSKDQQRSIQSYILGFLKGEVYKLNFYFEIFYCFKLLEYWSNHISWKALSSAKVRVKDGFPDQSESWDLYVGRGVSMST